MSDTRMPFGSRRAPSLFFCALQAMEKPQVNRCPTTNKCDAKTMEYTKAFFEKRKAELEAKDKKEAITVTHVDDVATVWKK